MCCQSMMVGGCEGIAGTVFLPRLATGGCSAMGGQGLFLPEKLGLDLPDSAGLARFLELRIFGAGLLLRTSQANDRRSGFGVAS